MKKQIFFFIGTEAEFIKLFPVIIECQRMQGICHIISSGQNDLKKSRIIDCIKLNGKFIELSKEDFIKKNAVGLFTWFVQTRLKAVRQIYDAFPEEDFTNVPFVVHGDTVSTFMGACIGKKLGALVCHVEAGLRSHHLFNPFPEEIDRLLTSRLARVHFAPGQEAENNLAKVKGEIINTEYNTILDSLNYSKSIPTEMKEISSITLQDYFVFVMHRQENLANREFVRNVLEEVKALAQNKKCVLILHKITENALEELGQLQELKKNDSFVLLPRVDYFDFMKLLQSAQFVITDGGSNQEELCYMGKPCLIMRKTTERTEGLGENAILYDGNIRSIQKFALDYERYQSGTSINKSFPSQIIARNLINR